MINSKATKKSFVHCVSITFMILFFTTELCHAQTVGERVQTDNAIVINSDRNGTDGNNGREGIFLKSGGTNWGGNPDFTIFGNRTYSFNPLYIGTSKPSGWNSGGTYLNYMLEVRGDIKMTNPTSGGPSMLSSATDLILVADDNNTANQHLRFFTGGITSSYERMRIQANGNVGIGTTNAPHKFSVRDANGVIASFGKGTTSTGRLVYIMADDDHASIGTRTNNDFSIKANNQDKMTIKTNGNIETKGDIRMDGRTNHALSSWSKLWLVADDDGLEPTEEGIQFFTGGTASTNEKMRIQANGNVGIGTTDATHKLSVRDANGVIASFGKGTTSTGRLVYIMADDDHASIGTRTNNDFSIKANNQDKMFVHTNGDVTINSGGTDILNQVSINADKKVDHAALTVAGAVYIGPQAEKAADDDLDKFDQQYINDYNLWVEDGIVTEDFVIINVDDWSDHVFKEEYNLPELTDVEQFIKRNGHLKNVPSEREVKEVGYKQHDINKVLLEKVEELTLYIIDQDKRIEALEGEINHK